MASGDWQDRIGIVVPSSSTDGGAADEAALRATLQSLRDQTHSEMDVVVVQPTALPLPVEDERVRSLTCAASGTAERLSVGARALRTKWIRFLPAGDRLAPGCLAAEFEAVADSDVAAVFSAVEHVDEAGAVSTEARPDDAPLSPGRHAAGSLLPDLVGRHPWPLGSALLDREVFLELGGFDSSFVARPEYELWLRLVQGQSVLVLPAPGLRRLQASARAIDASVDGAEHARALLRTLRGDPLEAAVTALGGAERDSPAQGIARAELARRLLQTERAELRPLAGRLVGEARAAGAYFPGDAPFEVLGLHMPELVRAEGWFAPPPAPPAVDEELHSPPPGAFPAPICVALGTASDLGMELAKAGAAAAEALEQRGVRLILLHARGPRGDAPPAADLPVEILRHDGSNAELEAALARNQVALLIADPSHPAVDVAVALGVPTWSGWPEGDDSERQVAEDVIRAAASHAAELRRDAFSKHRAVARSADTGVAEDAALRTLVGALGDAGAAVRSQVDSESLVERLSDARRAADSAGRRARDGGALAERALDKLRIGRRLRSTLQRNGASSSETVAPVVSLDDAGAQRFLGSVTSEAEARLWVLYTTDPYSETQGQRSTWLAREILARGDFVVFFYWRWELSEAIAAAPHDRLLPVPIDQFFRLQRPLMDLAAPGLEKIFLMEFPDAYLFEQIDLANAHGFTTVYDCVDDWEEFARVGQAHWYDPGVERHLAQNADLVVATHPVLAARLEAMGRRGNSVPVLPNGVAVESFAGAEPRSRTGEPVIGYFGHLTPAWFDWDLVRDTARAHPEWRFEIIGHGAPDDLDLPANVDVPGPVPHEALEERTRSWHVGIVPFLPGPLTQAVDPIKLYEYLALGLPSVVVDMPHLAGVPSVEVCNRADFAPALSRALSSKPDVDAVAAFVEVSRWSERVNALCDALASADSSDLLKAL
ncbi:MAG: glycosyltransferase [Candidatus Binatia bacterium]|nr:glycosyltransferase [Candidatus Binatia bacterium]